MDWFLPLAAKSLVIAGGTLAMLQLTHRRSAADRSMIAHLGLLALALLPAAAFALPALEIAGPKVLATSASATVTPLTIQAAPEVAPAAAPFPVQAMPAESAAPVGWAFWLYVAPAALLGLLTLIALLRLAPLKARATVLVEPHWLSALAHAQRRMGFKNGAALLTSGDIRSPISWGLLRPVILLNSEVTEARDEAEAIIAHELAHVARLDWAKLVLSRLTTAIYWFNPLVWLLAREAHQLREEAADDAVLASNIEDTDYARLLVGIARHECRGLLIGAHGVAPAANSLSRRVRRVLDAASARAPGGWRWTVAAGFLAAGLAVPVAALQIVEPTIHTAAEEGRMVGGSAAAATPEVPTAISTSAVAAAATAAPTNVGPGDDMSAAPNIAASMMAPNGETVVRQSDGQVVTVVNGRTIVQQPDGQVVTVMPRNAPAAQRLNLGDLDQPIRAVNVRNGGTVLIRYGRVPRVRIAGGDQRNVSVSHSNGSLSVFCGRKCIEFTVEVTTPYLETLAIHGGGTIDVAAGFPTVDELTLAINSGGTINARMLRARTVAAATRGGGTILTFADDTLAASTSGGGTIRHWGGAEVAPAVHGDGRIEPGGT